MHRTSSCVLVGVLLLGLVGCGTSHETDAVGVAAPSPTLTATATPSTPSPLPELTTAPAAPPVVRTARPQPRGTTTDSGCPVDHPKCTTFVNYPTGEDCGTSNGGGYIGAKNTVSSPEGLTLTVEISPCHVGKKRAGEEKGENSIFLGTHLVRPASSDIRIDVSWGDGTTENLIAKPFPCGGRDFGSIDYGSVGHQWTTAGKKLIHVHYVIQTCEPQPSNSPNPNPTDTAEPSATPTPFESRTESIDITVPVFVHDTTPWIVHH